MNQAAATTEPRPAVGPANILAQMLRYSGQILQAETLRLAELQLVRRLPEVLPVDRAVLVRLQPSVKLLAADAGVDALQQGEFAQQLRKFASKRHPEMQLPVAAVELDLRSEATRQAQGGSSVYWLPLLPANGQSKQSNAGYALWLERWQGRTWQTADIQLLHRLMPFFLAALQIKRTPRRWRGWIIAAVVMLLLAGMALIPVQQAAVAQARVMPVEPVYLFAPLAGVLKSVNVQPGQRVQRGDVLMSYDADLLAELVAEAQQAVLVERAELVRLEGAAVADVEARAALPVQKLKLEQAVARAQYHVQQQQKADVKALKSGVVILEDPERLEGRAVQVGEELLSIADISQHQLRLEVPVRDSGIFSKGAEVAVRLDSTPLQVKQAQVTHIAYDVSRNSIDQPVVFVDARWQGDEQAVLGQQGSARIYGESVPLAVQLFRKPILATLDLLAL